MVLFCQCKLITKSVSFEYSFRYVHSEARTQLIADGANPGTLPSRWIPLPLPLSRVDPSLLVRPLQPFSYWLPCLHSQCPTLHKADRDMCLNGKELPFLLGQNPHSIPGSGTANLISCRFSYRPHGLSPSP